MSKVTLSILCVALLACMAMGTVLAWKVRQVDGLTAENTRLENNGLELQKAVDSAKFASEVLVGRLKQSTALNVAAASDIDTIMKLKGDCLDENIDPSIADILGRRGLQPESDLPDAKSGSP